MYVGYGTSVDRALAQERDNDKFVKWLEKQDFDLSVAGPYGSAERGKEVEAALISAIAPEFNRAPGEGPKFRPVGVPPELADRTTLPALSLSEIGKRTGGALLVYLASGDYLKDVERDAQVDDEGGH